jgi:hypothetical protein
LIRKLDMSDGKPTYRELWYRTLEEGRRPLGKHWHRWENNTKWILNKYGRRI